MGIYAQHWLYDYIPHNRGELPEKSCIQKIMWAVFGNDDDGIFGEGPKSGTKWTEKWGGKSDKTIGYHNPGEISFKRFVRWQIRNPLHNFTGYVVGFKGQKDIILRQCMLITTQEMSFCKILPEVGPFPMGDHSGIYVGLHNKRPFLSWRVYLFSKSWLEGYGGWRPGGALGFAFRNKKPKED